MSVSHYKNIQFRFIRRCRRWQQCQWWCWPRWRRWQLTTNRNQQSNAHILSDISSLKFMIKRRLICLTGFHLSSLLHFCVYDSKSYFMVAFLWFKQCNKYQFSLLINHTVNSFHCYFPSKLDLVIMKLSINITSDGCFFLSYSLHQHNNFVVFLLGNVKQILFCQPIVFHGVRTAVCLLLSSSWWFYWKQVCLSSRWAGWFNWMLSMRMNMNYCCHQSINQVIKKTQFWQTHTHTSIIPDERACAIQHTQHDLMNFYYN